MTRPSIAHVICCGVLVGCGSGTPDHSVARIGVVARFLDGQACLAVADSGLTVGQRFEAASVPVVGAVEGSVAALVEITGVHPGTCAGLWGAFGDADYSLRIVNGDIPPSTGGPSIALVGGTATLVRENGTLRTDLDADGMTETFRSCTSFEGLHITLWSGTPLASERLWHTYFSLGYDVEPSCTDADYQAP